jgi:four helix bundle protein
MAFDTYDRSLDLLRALAPVTERIRARDAGLADQLKRAAQSVLLNIAEANRRRGKDRANRFRCALGEAAEVSAAVEAAIVAEYVEAIDVVDALALADRVRAMAFQLAKKAA